MTHLSEKEHKAQMAAMKTKELAELLEKEFSLPYFEFVYDGPMEQREENQACLSYPES